jgi:hypothetical protein
MQGCFYILQQGETLGIVLHQSQGIDLCNHLVKETDIGFNISIKLLFEGEFVHLVNPVFLAVLVFVFFSKLAKQLINALGIITIHFVYQLAIQHISALGALDKLFDFLIRIPNIDNALPESSK